MSCVKYIVSIDVGYKNFALTVLSTRLEIIYLFKTTIDTTNGWHKAAKMIKETIITNLEEELFDMNIENTIYIVEKQLGFVGRGRVSSRPLAAVKYIEMVVHGILSDYEVIEINSRDVSQYFDLQTSKYSVKKKKSIKKVESLIFDGKLTINPQSFESYLNLSKKDDITDCILNSLYVFETRIVIDLC